MVGMTKLDEIMNKAGIDNQQLAKLAGCKPVEIWRLRKGPNANGRKMTEKWASRLGPLLNVAPSQLLFEDIDAAEIITEIKHAKIIGDVAAGRWFEQSDFIDDDLPLIPLVPGKYSTLEQFAFKVVGPSMDLRRIQNGDFVICVRYFEARAKILDGDICVVERRNGHLIERTCKEIKTVNGGFQLWPRSSSPQFQTPIFVPDKRKQETDDGIHIEIIGLVIGRFTAF